MGKAKQGLLAYLEAVQKIEAAILLSRYWVTAYANAEIKPLAGAFFCTALSRTDNGICDENDY